MDEYKLVKEINFSSSREGRSSSSGIMIVSLILTLLIQGLGNILLGFEVLSGWEYLLIVMIPMVLLHEGLHSLVFLANGFKVKFGVGAVAGGVGFWTSSPGSKLNRKQFRVLAITPQILSVACMIGLLFQGSIPEYLIRGLISFLAMNLGGGVSDIYLFLLLSTYPKSILIEDTKMGCKIYSSEAI